MNDNVTKLQNYFEAMNNATTNNNNNNNNNENNNNNKHTTKFINLCIQHTTHFHHFINQLLTQIIIMAIFHNNVNNQNNDSNKT